MAKDTPKMISRWAQNRPKMGPKRSKNESGEDPEGLWMDPQRGQVEAKLTQDGSKFVHVAWRCPRAAQDVPKMGQDDTKVAPRRPKRAPRWPQEGPRWHQKSPKRAQDEAKMAQHRARPSKLMPIRPKVQNH